MRASIKNKIIVFLIIGVNASIGFSFIIGGAIMAIQENIPIWKYLLSMYPLLAYALFFTGILIYAIIKTIKYTISKPVEEITICKMNKDKYLFVNQKRKLYSSTRTFKKNIEINQYYKITRRDDEIINIEETTEKIPFNGIKEGFWTTFYTPNDIYKDVAYLPIIYTIAVMFLPSIIAIPVLGIIGYDLYTKIRVSNRKKKILNENYTYEDIENIERSIQGEDAPFFEKIFKFYQKHRPILIILFIVLLCLIFYLLVK